MTRPACEHLGVEVAGHDDDGADVDVWMDGWMGRRCEGREGEAGRLNGGQGRVRGEGGRAAANHEEAARACRVGA